MPAPWPKGFDRIPDEAWTRQPVKALAEDYDTVEQHGWYANLDPTVEEVTQRLSEGDIVLDYSGGTGILIDRLLDANPDREIGLINVDSSRKFLRLALEKFRDEPRVAFRLIAYLKDQGRLQQVDEVLGRPLLDRGIDGLTSTNAVHLYYDLPETVAAWCRVLKPGAWAHVQSGNIGLPDTVLGDAWIIDETVHAVAREAETIVQDDDAYASYRDVLDDEDTMAQYHTLREKYFLPARPLDDYTSILEDGGFEIVEIQHRPITARTDEWLSFLSVYHEGILGWVGGAEKIEGEPATPEAVEDRQDLMARALDRVLDGASSFEAMWTYITCRRPADA